MTPPYWNGSQPDVFPLPVVNCILYSAQLSSDLLFFVQKYIYTKERITFELALFHAH